MVNKKLRATWVFPWTSLSQGTQKIPNQRGGNTIGHSEDFQLHHKARDHHKNAVEEAVQKHFRSISERRKVSTESSVTGYNRRESERKGPACRRTKRELGERRTARGKRQQVDQTPLPPPSIPISRQRKIGIENMFVDKNGELPHNRIIALAVARLERLAKWT